jgi:hypothetical protein
MSKLTYVTPTVKMIGSFESTTLNTGHGETLDFNFSQTPHHTVPDVSPGALAAGNELS